MYLTKSAARMTASFWIKCICLIGYFPCRVLKVVTKDFFFQSQLSVQTLTVFIQPRCAISVCSNTSTHTKILHTPEQFCCSLTQIMAPELQTRDIEVSKKHNNKKQDQFAGYSFKTSLCFLWVCNSTVFVS